MPRLTLDITKEQHRQLKTISSFSGLSMKEFILSRVFAEAAETVFTGKKTPQTSDDEAHQLQELLFKKAQIIVLSPEKWSKLQGKLKKKI